MTTPPTLPSPDVIWAINTAFTAWLGPDFTAGAGGASTPHIQGVFVRYNDPYLWIIVGDEDNLGNLTLTQFTYDSGTDTWIPQSTGGKAYTMKLSRTSATVGWGHGGPFAIDVIAGNTYLWTSCEDGTTGTDGPLVKLAHVLVTTDGAPITLSSSGVTIYDVIPAGATELTCTITRGSDTNSYFGIRYVLDGKTQPWYQVYNHDQVISLPPSGWTPLVTAQFPEGCPEPTLLDHEGNLAHHQGWTMLDRYVYILGGCTDTDHVNGAVMWSVDLCTTRNIEGSQLVVSAGGNKTVDTYMVLSNPPHDVAGGLEPEGITSVHATIGGTAYASPVYVVTDGPPHGANGKLFWNSPPATQATPVT